MFDEIFLCGLLTIFCCCLKHIIVFEIHNGNTAVKMICNILIPAVLLSVPYSVIHVMTLRKLVNTSTIRWADGIMFDKFSCVAD